MADDIGIQQEMLIEPTHKKLEIVDGHAVKDVEDYQNPELLYKSLIERVRKYHPSADVSMIEKAYHIAHGNPEKSILSILCGLESFWHSWRWTKRRSLPASFMMWLKTR